MAMSWENVEAIRQAQSSAQGRFADTKLLVEDEIRNLSQTEGFKNLAAPRLTEIEQMIFRLRSELIDYIVAHGLVDGLIWNGVLQPVENGKIVITKDMVEEITRMLGYFTEADIQAFLEKYLPENFYVSDEHYVHTDNNYTTPEKEKLSGIEASAEVNKVIDVIFNGTSVLDDGTRVATITITKEDIKRWYEGNPDTNCFTDAQKEKLAGISAGAEVNRVDDVLVDGRSVLDENKKAKITKEIVKTAYEANPDTNCFTDAYKAQVDKNQALSEKNAEDINTANGKIQDNSDSISELGDEVNSVGGRVTTLETDSKTNLKSTQITFPIPESFSGDDGVYDVSMKFGVTLHFQEGTKMNQELVSHGTLVKKITAKTPAERSVLCGTITSLYGSYEYVWVFSTSGEGSVQQIQCYVIYPKYDPDDEKQISSIEYNQSYGAPKFTVSMLIGEGASEITPVRYFDFETNRDAIAAYVVYADHIDFSIHFTKIDWKETPNFEVGYPLPAGVSYMGTLEDGVFVGTNYKLSSGGKLGRLNVYCTTTTNGDTVSFRGYTTVDYTDTGSDDEFFVNFSLPIVRA